jgi:hypothetical protein
VRFAVRLQPSRIYLVQDTLTGRIREATYELLDAPQVAARLEQSGGFATVPVQHGHADRSVPGLAARADS